MSKWVLFPSEKGFTLKGKNLFLLGANSFLSSHSLQEEISVHERKQAVTKVVSLMKNGVKIYFVYPAPLNSAGSMTNSAGPDYEQFLACLLEYLG